MRKIIVLTTLMLTASLANVNAQSLLDILNGRSSSKTEKKTENVEKINLDALRGKWKYTGAAVEFTGSDLVAVLGSSMAAPSIKQSLETYYAKVGVVPGSCTLEFKNDDKYVARTAAHSIDGPYKFDAQNQKVKITYDHPELGGKNSLDARLTFTGETLRLTFEADQIIAIIKELTKDQKLDQSIKDLIDMVSEYKGLYLGFELEK